MFHLVLQATAIVVTLVVARKRMLPHDLSYVPLSIVLGSQVCLLALWLVHGRAAWPAKAIAVVAFIGLSAGVRWIADGMSVFGPFFWYVTCMVGTPVVPLVGLMASEALLHHRFKAVNCDDCTPERITYSISDLLTLMLIFGVATAVLVTFPPKHSEFQYIYDFYGYVLRLSVSSAIVVTATLVVFRACRAHELQFRTVIVALGLMLIVGRLAAWSLGVRANPLWASYTLDPCLTVSLVALSLIVQRVAEGRSVRDRMARPSVNSLASA